MGYIVNQDIIDRVGLKAAVEVSAESGTGVNTTVLDECRLGAEGEANGYLARRFQVPIDLVAHPDLVGVLKTKVLDIAVWQLMNRRPPADERYLKARDRAVEWLKMVSEGKIELPSSTPVATTTSTSPVAAWGSNEPILNDLRNQ